MAKRGDARVHSDTNPRNGSNILELSLFRLLLVATFLESLKKFEQNILGDFTPSSFQVGEPRESEIWIKLVCCRIKRPSHGHSFHFWTRLTLHSHAVPLQVLWSTGL